MFEKDEVFVIPENALEDKILLGEGLNGLLLVVHAVDFTIAEEETLQKLVAAIGYDYVQDSILWKWSAEQNFSLGLLDITYRDILLFGLTPDQIGIFVDYKPYTVHFFEQKRMLVSDGIRDINSQPAKKQVLWNALKQMFLSK
jgi:hypothetical protein